MTYGQKTALDIAKGLVELIKIARIAERDLGDSSFGRAADQMQTTHDALRSRAGA